MSTPGSGSAAGPCAAHPWLTEDTRILAEQLLDHVEPWVQRLQQPDPEHAEELPATCEWCPLCALIATWRGQRPELTRRFAENAAGLIAAAREALARQPTAGGGPARGDQDDAREPAQDEAEQHRVEHIDVRRRPGSDGC